MEEHLALGAGAGNQIVHAVQTAQQGALAAARGADKGRYVVSSEIQVHFEEGLEVTVVEIEVSGLHRECLVHSQTLLCLLIRLRIMIAAALMDSIRTSSMMIAAAAMLRN